MSAPAYVIVEMHIRDLEQYKQYMAEAPAAVKAAGGEYLVRGGRHEALEGDWNPARFVMLKFPSVEQARAFYNSVEYEAAKKAREGAAVMRMLVVEGV